MRGGTTFADVLEQTLRASQPDPSVRRTSPSCRPAPPPPFLFGPRYVHATPRTHGAMADVRPLRRLTASQQRALGDLIRLGANLRPDFTAHELRSAFRTLARCYHPDRHPLASKIEKARFSGLFTDLTNNHQHLLVALKPART